MLKSVRDRNRQNGFTIIEVMIVLVIAGLIMLIVFSAIPQLNRNQRNTRRKDNANRISSELVSYGNNNNGSFPTADSNSSTGFSAGGGFPTRYLSQVSYTEPNTGANMILTNWTNDAAATSVGTLYYTLGRVCNGEASQPGQARQYVLMVPLEGGAIYCVDNH